MRLEPITGYINQPVLERLILKRHLVISFSSEGAARSYVSTFTEFSRERVIEREDREVKEVGGEDKEVQRGDDKKVEKVEGGEMEQD